MSLPTDNADRKALPMWTFLMEYFPDTFLAVLGVSIAGNKQHHDGKPLHWDRAKSTDQMNTAFRHMWDHGRGTTKDTDGQYHLAKAVWRLSAELQLTIERERADKEARICIEPGVDSDTGDTRITRETTPEEIDAVCARLSYIPTRNVTGLTNGKAVILYDQWTQNSVCVHSYIPPHSLTRGFLREMFRYPYEAVEWVIGVTPGDNEAALRFNKHIGFKEIYRLRDGFAPGVDNVFQTVHRSECRYYKRTKV